MKRAQKKFERDRRKNFFLRAKPYRLVKAKNCEQSSQFNNNNKKKKPGKKNKKVGKFDETRPKKFLKGSETKTFFASETLRACEGKKSRTKFVI